MIKNEKKITFLDYSILFVSLIFFSIVYFYSAIIWPREEKFKNIDRSRMERIDDAQRLYNSLSGDYMEDAATLFALIEAVRDTLDGDEFFEGKKDVILANKYEQYVIRDIFGDSNNNDTVLVKKSEVKSFQFSEGIKLYSQYIQSKTDSDLSVENIQNRLIDDLVYHTTNRKSSGTDIISWKNFTYTMNEKDLFIASNIYPIGFFYRNFIDGQILNKEDLEKLTYTIDIPPGFKNRLDTTFTKPIKVEEKYKEMIYAVRVMNFDPTDNFLDIGNGVWNPAENFTDINGNGIWDVAEEFTENNGRYDEGEEFVDINRNGIWDTEDIFEDVKNRKYDIGEPFIDAKNGIWDEGEEFTDMGDGIWDPSEDYIDEGNGRYDMGEDFINYIFSDGFIPRDYSYSTEVYYTDNKETAYKFSSMDGHVIGAIYREYDTKNHLIKETWCKGETSKILREFSSIFDPSTGDFKLIERDKNGDIVKQEIILSSNN